VSLVQTRDWLRQAAGVPGFTGFAVGCTVFWEPLAEWRAEKLAREAAAAEIGRRYREFVEVCEDVRCETA
jgi:myo-inositol catabolism protein IolC